jgi:hypothetical protein
MVRLYAEIPFPETQVEYFLRDINIHNSHLIDYNPEWYPVLIPEYLYQYSEINPMKAYKLHRHYIEMYLLVELKKLQEKEVIIDDYFFDIYFHRLLYGFSMIFDDTASILYMIQNDNYKPIVDVSKQLDVLSLFYSSSSPIESKYQLCTKMIPIFIQTLQEFESAPICKYQPYYTQYQRYLSPFGHSVEQTHRSLQKVEYIINGLLFDQLTHHLEKLIHLRDEIQNKLFPEITKITSDLFLERQLSRIINAYL